MSKIIKTLRNNWKKTIFFSGCGLYGASYLENIYRYILNINHSDNVGREF